MSEKNSIYAYENNISPKKISNLLCDSKIPEPVVYNITQSTNTDAKLLAQKGCAPYQCVIAAEQTNGRGRLGRSFFSPKGSGLYISVVAYPKIGIEKSLFLTTAAAVCMCEAVEECFGISLDIKWVNDLYKDGKKVCGILTEAATVSGTQSLCYAVVGLGINLYTPPGGFPAEISQIATALLKEKDFDCENKLVAAFLKRFKNACENLESSETRTDIAKRYRSRSFAVGKDVYIINGEERTAVRVLDIDDECRLLAEYPDGTKKTVSAGEISIRIIN